MSRAKKITIAFTALALVAVAGSALLSRIYVVPVLMYHSVYAGAGSANMLAIRTATFERQMHFLRTHGYRVVPLEEVAGLLRAKRPVPHGTVAITFDDGYADNYNEAFAVLKEYKIPAAVFLIYNEVGRPQNDRLEWYMIKNMQASGLITFGSHTLGAEPLINMASQDDVRRQIAESKRVLGENLGREVGLFSYPEGKFTPAIRQMVIDAGYTAAVATNTGRRGPPDDVYALKRLRISENSANMFIFWFETSGYYTFFKDRKKK